MCGCRIASNLLARQIVTRKHASGQRATSAADLRRPQGHERQRRGKEKEYRSRPERPDSALDAPSYALPKR
jgi:hypothetical protein